MPQIYEESTQIPLYAELPPIEWLESQKRAEEEEEEPPRVIIIEM